MTMLASLRAWAASVNRDALSIWLTPRDAELRGATVLCPECGAEPAFLGERPLWAGQEVRDLSLILSRQIGVTVDTKLPRAHASDSAARAKADAALMVGSHCLTATLTVPDAAAPIDVAVDLGKRTNSASLLLRAPTDRKSAKARLNRLLRQLHKAPDTVLHIRLHWPFRAPHTQHTLAELRENPDIASQDNPDRQPHTLEVCMIRQLAGRFGQRKNFVADLEQLTPAFYEAVGHHLKASQPPAPRVREDRAEPEGVAREGLQEAAEEGAEEASESGSS